MTTGATILKKRSINKPRAISLLPNIDDLKENNGDWETLSRKLYEIFHDEYSRLDSSILEKLNQHSTLKTNQDSGRKSDVLTGSIKHEWAKQAVIYKKKNQIKSNIQAARNIIHFHNKINPLQINEEELEKLAQNLSKRMSEDTRSRKR